VRTRSRRLALVGAVLATTGFGLIAVLAPSGQLGLVVDDLGTTLVAGIAAASCWSAARRSTPRARRGWRLVGAACASWCLGNAVWATYELLLDQEVPFPSAADLGYLGFVPLALVGVVLLGPVLRRAGSVKRIVDIVLITVALGGVGWIVVLAPVAASTDNPLERVLALAYPVGDLLILAAVLSVVTLMTSRPPGLALLTAGLVLFALADGSFAYLTATGGYASGNLSSVAWFAGFLAIALAARPVDHAAGLDLHGHARLTEAVTQLPIVAVGILAASQGILGNGVPAATVWLILAVGVLNILRQAAANHRDVLLTRALEERVVALDVERQRSSAVIDGARDPYVETDRDGTVVRWNEPAETAFGWSSDHLRGRSFSQVIPERTRAAALERVARFLDTRDPGVWGDDADLVVLRSDGEEVPVEVTAWDSGHGGDYRIHAFLRDISERRAAEVALAASEQRWQLLVRHSSDVTLLLDASGAVADEVPAASMTLGYDDGANNGRHFAELVHPDDLDVVADAFDRVRGTPGHQERARFRVRRIDGTWAHIEAVATNLLDEPTVGGIVANLRDVTDQVRAEEELRRQARQDPLTGLPNRNLMTDALAARCRRGEGHAALLLMDLDGFKDINDGLGHDMGDRLLVQLAQRLDRATRADDVVARLGGDEFAVLLCRLPSPAHAVRIAQQLSQIVENPIRLDDVTVEVGVSIGIAACRPGDDPLAVLQRADVAMYRAKRQRSGHAVYGTGDDEERRNSVKVAADLRDAIDQGGLVVHYQPKIELATGRVDSVEALVRWQHPERGLLPPDTFIALAERTGLIRDLTTFVLRASLHQCATWRSEGFDVPVAVNLSPRTLGQSGLVGVVRSALEDTDVPAGHLTLEITENAFPENTRVLSATLRQLGDLGVRLSVDDFGTGWSSLSKLKELPVQELKIDRSFVVALAEDATDHSIVRSIIELARSLGLTVVAEGVEAEQVRRLLEHLGCPLAQGYLFSRPLPGPRLTGWMASRERAGIRPASSVRR
jgi:diguanylate cyclase (GGDEF)-like protein/PAS domain S-box-containing protein